MTTTPYIRRDLIRRRFDIVAHKLYLVFALKNQTTFNLLKALGNNEPRHGNRILDYRSLHAA
jgi:hypothetical protein